ncbi:pirin family protein [Paucibacter sp. PLA-PC-4]|uniref:pirin family protein n=1 Tax=Paucibacter sp. PLA-PC-4 TaxID=2993655 RepID=UPI002248A374|nr:pirin family protein [Paucibacter sp. PLA-PC-4]MCX2861550.1 pirin family protein [Paucibacter sp. PLA-PC-4]
MALIERFTAKQGEVGGLPISRALPVVGRRTVGAWCFMDHAGPATLAPGRGMRVGPHPHTGLQTFSWMIEGEILHRDSLGSEQVLRAGQVNLMTAGRGICHSEESLTDRLQLAQLWIALPEHSRFTPPRFEHFAELPQLSLGGFAGTLLVGSHDGARSPVPSDTELLGMDLACVAAAVTELQVQAHFEYGLMALEGELTLQLDNGETASLQPGELLYLAPGQTRLLLRSAAAARLLLLGGPPFPEPLLLWWNFVGRSPDEIRRFAADWNAGLGFGEVRGYDGARLLAPDVPALRAP